MLFASMYERPTGRISENTLSGRKNKIMNKVEKNNSDKCSSVGCSVDQ